MPDEIVTKSAPSDAPSPDKVFADYLKVLLEGENKPADKTEAFFAKTLKEQRGQHDALTQNIQKGEQQLMGARSEIMRLEGRIEAGVTALRHLFES